MLIWLIFKVFLATIIVPDNDTSFQQYKVLKVADTDTSSIKGPLWFVGTLCSKINNNFMVLYVASKINNNFYK